MKQTIKIILIIVIVCSLILVNGCTYQHGTSRDIVQGYDKGIIWHHAYLKNDHTTAYCFDNESFIPILDESQKTQREVIVTYETYLFRGFLCTTSEKYEKVVIADIKFADEGVK